MSAKLELVLSEIKQLSLEELVVLQENLSLELRYKTQPPAQLQVQAGNRVKIPGAYRPTSEQVKATLAVLFAPEELARMGKTDFSKLPAGLKSASEMLNEDREDRF